MRVLVVGKGGREHAIVKGLALCPSVQELHVVPGSAGMDAEALCHDFDPGDHEALVSFCKRKSIDLVVIGPEDPLTEGMADSLRQADIAVFGPGQQAAQLEGSKIFSKEFMQKGGIPTAPFSVVDSVDSTMAASEKYTTPYVLKADGLAAGKGVFICKDQQELKSAATQIFEDKKFGDSGRVGIIEQFQPGRELSVFVLTNGKDYVRMPFAQDHKRLQDGNVGPNTGGMGAFAPMPIDEKLEALIDSEIIKPTVQALQDQQLDYRGVLFIGIMATEDGPKVLEYNVRFGDPEAQVLIPLLDGDWAQTYMAIAQGEVPELRFRKVSVSCVVMASPGYPQAAQKDVPLVGDPSSGTANSYFIHAGTKRADGNQWVTDGGRVLGAVGIGDTIDNAIQIAYKQAGFVDWSGIQMRKDIGEFRLEV